MQNEDIRNYAIEKKVRLWQIADRLGLQDSNFSKKLRKEFLPEKKSEIRKIIDELAEERQK